MDKVKELIAACTESVPKVVHDKFDALTRRREEVFDDANANDDNLFAGLEDVEVAAVGSSTGRQHKCFAHQHNGAFWQVPKGFDFPNETELRGGWRLWFAGQDSHEVKARDCNGEGCTKALVRPCCLFKPMMIPLRLEMSAG